MLRIYLIEIISFSFCLAAYDKCPPINAPMQPNVYEPYLTSSLVHNHVKISLILEIVLRLLNNLFFIIHKKKIKSWTIDS
jgi:hypothetical protein